MAIELAKCSLASGATLAAVGGLSKLWLTVLARTRIVNADRLTRLVEDRPPDQPLITVANHYACMDDPLLWSALPWRILLAKPCLLRWTLAARDIVFTKPIYEKFFGLGRCIPVDRGRGVYQEAMERCLEVLNTGGWVHIFPEGKINLTKESMRLKWGVGRLIADCRFVPKVLPMHHLGFDEVLPNKQPYIPKVGQRATLVIGDLIEVGETVQELKAKSATAIEQRLVLTQLIQEKMLALRTTAEAIHNSPSISGDDASCGN